MIISTSFRQAQPNRDTAIALGLFDGVHRGHQKVIQEVLACRAIGLAPSIFTYSIHHKIPAAKKNFAQIISDEDKMQLLETIGIEYVVQPDFEEFCNVSPRDFVEKLLIDKMRAKVICCGKDFRFGRAAAGTVEELCRYAEPLGTQVRIVDPVYQGQEIISSTGIRACLKEGKMDLARNMLGRCYSINFLVEHGEQLGRWLNFPTINQAYPAQFAVPRYGVYISATQVGDTIYPSISNVGVKPTVGANGPLAETFILHFSGNLYGSRVRVWLCEFVRGECRFASIEDLKAQIEKDTETARQKGPKYAKELAEQTGLHFCCGQDSKF